MTRLTSDDLAGLISDLELYDEELLRKTGRTLRQIGCRAARIDEKTVLGLILNTRVGVVAMTAGEGIIPGFVESVREIIRHLGFAASVPEWPDVAGLAWAIEQGSDIVIMADDLRFVAVNLSHRRVVDNAEATGRGYGAAMEGLAKGVQGRRVLVIGAGRVGCAAARILTEMGAQIAVFDPKRSRADQLAQELGGVVEDDLERALQAHPLLIDACPASGIIQARHIQPFTMVAAPGVPLGLTAEAQACVQDCLIHDPLEIGVATMVISAARP